VHEKYQALARDAMSSGDRVAAENYLQHAEHYYRIIEAINEATMAEQRARGITPGTPYGQQPEVPGNYYGGAQAPVAAVPPGDANAAPGAVAAQPQAEVVQRPVQSPFFAPDEAPEDNAEAPQPLMARR
jgi:hypothetical protein